MKVKKQVIEPTTLREHLAQAANKRRPKFGATRSRCGRPECGFHASKREAIRCGELQCLQKGKLIRDLKYQPEFDLWAFTVVADTEGGVKVGTYTADWSYAEFDRGAWVDIVEDSKGVETREFRRTIKILKANYGIELRLTK